MPEMPQRGSGKPSLTHRVSLVERDQRQLAQSVTNLVNALDTVMGKIHDLEQWRVDVRIMGAAEAERDKALALSLGNINNSISELKDDINKIRGTWTKLAWVVVTPVVGTMVIFALSGGFRNMAL